MPTYDYVCTECKHKWEHTASIKEKPLTDCPKCGKKTAKRQISAGTSFILQGTGWFKSGGY